MSRTTHYRLQLVVFALVSASFTNIYLTQPVLPVLQAEFSVDLVQVSLTVSAVILGIALANLPFGLIVDRLYQADNSYRWDYGRAGRDGLCND